MTAPRIFCAVDTPDLSPALELVKTLSALPLGVKLGLEFFIAQGAAGMEKVRAAAGEGTEIFLDLKLHDIPNTVAGALRAAMRARPDFITLHASGGMEMMKAAQEAAQDVAAKEGVAAPKLLGVTVLTSLDDVALERVGQLAPALEQVERLAVLAEMAGLSGVVCSPHEIAHLRKMVKQPFLLVVPGIRPAGSAAGDQKRVMTPAQAAELGADYLVVGRPITQAQDPQAAARAILESVEKRAA
ncbi:MAG: orotidine-5'-phosphate decarboxylase [Alphaproteobacteria bacterium]|nr:orotidine-5'-phosphate decarboxylase [Alphaproteobacteria bacterium]